MGNSIVVIKRTILAVKIAASIFILWIFDISNDVVKVKIMNELTARKLDNTHESYALPELVDRLWEYSGIIIVILIILMFASDIIDLINNFQKTKEDKEKN